MDQDGDADGGTDVVLVGVDAGLTDVPILGAGSGSGEGLGS